MTLTIDYRRRDGFAVTLTVPDERWEAAMDYCNQYFCGHLPPLPDVAPRKPGESVTFGKGGARGKSR